MNPADFIEPSLENALPIVPIVRNGRLKYCVHGICVVDSVDEALDLIKDRRVAPRRDTDFPAPAHVIQYGTPAEGTIYIRANFGGATA